MAQHTLSRRSWTDTSLAAARAIAMALAVLTALVLGMACASYARAGTHNEGSEAPGRASPLLDVNPLR